MTTMEAFVTDGKGSGSIKSVPRPTPGPGEILVKIHHAALNPGDWKIVEGGVAVPPAPEGLVAGCDFAGTIADANGTNWTQGERVAGFVFGGLPTTPGRGAFAEYITIESTLVFAVPDNITLQQASTIPLAFATATQAVLQHLGLPDPHHPSTTQRDFLVYAASTSVGLYAVQLGKLSGQRVIAVASRRNHNLLKHLGADVTIDYRDEDWIAQVREATGGKLQYAVDCIAEGGSPETVVKTLSQSEGDLYVGISPLNKDAIREANPHVSAKSMIAFTVFGSTLGLNVFDNERDSAVKDRKNWEEYLRWLPELLGQGRLEPNRVREVGTLDDILEGFQLSKGGGLSAEKAVFEVSL